MEAGQLSALVPCWFWGEQGRGQGWTAHSHSGCCTQTQVGKACDQNGVKGSLKIKKKTKAAGLLEQKSEIE